ncbi:unnamed protein product, partial [Rotaria sp. Silwood2]
MFDIQTILVRLVTDNASSNIKAFENLIIPGFANYFDVEDDDNDDEGSDVGLDDDNDNGSEELIVQNIDKDETNITELIKNSFDNVATSSESLRIPCFAHTIQLVVLRVPPSELNGILISIKRKDLCLLTKDYQMLNEFLSLLTLFAEATTLTHPENTPSISFIAPTVLNISYDLLQEQSNVIYTSSLCHTLLNSLVSRFGGLLEELGVDIDKSIPQKSSSDLYRDQILIYSSFLDGKFKLHWVTESSLPLEAKNFLCNKIKTMIYDNYVVLLHNYSSTTTHAVLVTDDEQLANATTPRSTPKRKSFFSNIESKVVKKQKSDNFAFIKEEIKNYLNDDDNDPDRFTLLHQST